MLVESRASEPIIPLRLFRNRTITLSSLASLFVGVAMFTGTVFFSQYFQLARDKSPTMSGVMTIPMIGGLFISSTVSGQVITKTGRWKYWLVSGGFLVTAGLGLLGTIRYDTAYWHIAIFMALLGLGIGMMMQNLVLSTQNQVAPADLGSASSTVTFFRSLGGAIGVSALGAVMANRITDYVKDGLTDLGPKYAALGSGSDSSIPDMDKLPAPLRTVMESAYGHGIADVFLIAAGMALIAFLIVLFIKEVPLRTSGALAQAAAEKSGEPVTEAPVAEAVEAAATAALAPAVDTTEAAFGTAPEGAQRLARRRHRDEGGHPPARVRRHQGARSGPRRRERARAAGRGHADLTGGTPARPLGRTGGRLLHPRRARCGLVRPDRLRRRLPAAGLDDRRERRAARVRHPAERHQRAERCRPGQRGRLPGQGRDGRRDRRPRRCPGHRNHR